MQCCPKLTRMTGCVLPLFTLGLVARLDAEIRPFSSSDGMTIEAELVEASEEKVTIRRRDGMLFKDVPLSRFRTQIDSMSAGGWKNKKNWKARRIFLRIPKFVSTYFAVRMMIRMITMTLMTGSFHF